MHLHLYLDEEGVLLEPEVQDFFVVLVLLVNVCIADSASSPHLKCIEILLTSCLPRSTFFSYLYLVHLPSSLSRLTYLAALSLSLSLSTQDKQT